MSNIVNELAETMCAYRKWHAENRGGHQDAYGADWEFSGQTEAGMLFKKAEYLLWTHREEALAFLAQCSALDFAIITYQGVLPYDADFQQAVIKMAEQRKKADKTFPLDEIVESILVGGERTEALVRADGEGDPHTLGDLPTDYPILLKKGKGAV